MIWLLHHQCYYLGVMSDHSEKEKDTLSRLSVVRVVFDLSESDNDLAPSEPMLFTWSDE